MRISKALILSFILIILSISCVNASEIDNDVQNEGVVDLDINDNVIGEDSIEGISKNSVDDSLIGENNPEDIENTIDNNIYDNSLKSDIDNENPLTTNNEDLILEKNTLTADSNNIHQVNPTNYSRYFNSNGYVLTDVVSSGDVIDLSGRFNKKNFIFTMPCSITSSQGDAYLTNCMVEFENVSADSSSVSRVSNLNFNTSIEKAPCVYILGSTYVEVFNCNAYSTGANSNPTLLVGSSYCHIHDNVFETTFTGYMNMSWKRAGILLGESHYNNISSNHVTVKDSNPIYLTTYGFEKSNYNIIFNNTVSTSAFSEETGLRNPSAWAYGVHIMGDYNTILNNTIMNTYRGVDSEGSFNQIIGNKIFNLSGSYYEGNNGTDGGEGGIFASYNNLIANNTIYDSKITGPAIYAVVNTTVYGNVIENITGPNGIQFALTASNCRVYNNTISMKNGTCIIVKGNMTNLTLSNNIISTNNGSGILILKQTRAKFPVDVTIDSNCFLENLRDCINYTDVEGKTILRISNNTAVVVNDTFFRFFSSDGSFNSNDLFENFIFKGEFADLTGENEASAVSTIDLNDKITIIGDNAYIKDISFNINSDNVKIDNILVNISDAMYNTFNFNNVKDGSLTNSIIYFNSSNENLVPIYGNNSKIILSNNIVVVYGDNSALILNNTNSSITDNKFNSSSLNHPAILNDNNSNVFFGENEINSLFNPAILTINGAVIQYTYFIIDDSNYYDYFNPDGSFLEDVIFNFGDTIRIGNVNNKIFRFDIPLIIVGQNGCLMNNSFILLEGESSGSTICNFTFKIENNYCSGDISIITIKDGVSDFIISDNIFDIYNLTGDISLSAIKLNPSDTVSADNLIENNQISIDSGLSQINGIIIKNEGLGLYSQIAENLVIRNNSISIINNKSDGISNGINLLSSSNSLILNNSIYIKSYSVNGILLEKSDLTIKNNTVEVYGLIYDEILNLISNNGLKEFLDDNQIRADFAISTDRNTVVNDDAIFDNVLIENNAKTTIVHFSNSLKDLENIIKNAKNGFSIDLGNNVYIVQDSIDVNKTLNIKNGILVSDLKEGRILFNLVYDSKNNPVYNSFSISDSTVILDNSNVFILVNSLNDANLNLINVPSMDVKNNEFIAINDKVVPESITLVKLVSSKRVLSLNNVISIVGNQISAGMKPFKFDIVSVANGSDIAISNNNLFNKRTPSRIICKDMLTTTVDTVTDGRVGQYFNVSLTDNKGNPLVKKAVKIGFNGVIYNVMTNNKGICQLQINLGYEGVYTFAVSFLGDDYYDASFVVAKITVKKQKPVISCSNYYYKASSKSKKISVSLKSASRKPLKNRTVKLVINGKTYSAKTNSRGIVTIKVSLSKKKTYSFTVKYAGDHIYSAVSKSAKLTVS